MKANEIKKIVEETLEEKKWADLERLLSFVCKGLFWASLLFLIGLGGVCSMEYEGIIRIAGISATMVLLMWLEIKVHMVED
jgi:hypothetical protein